MINDILKRVEYSGSTQNCKLYYKRRNKNSVILEDTHEGIISKELFEKAQTIISKRRKSNKTSDDVRLKSFYFFNDNAMIAMKYDSTHPYYYSSKYHINIRADYLHEVTYQYCLEMFKKLRRKNSLYVSQVKEEFNVSDLEKKKSELEKESKKLIRNYEKLVEYKLSGLVEEIDFILKKDVFDNKMKYIEEQINQVVFEIAQVEEKEKHFYKELDELENVNKKINKLDFIRALATRCDITKTEDGYELNIKFKFQL